MKKPFDWKIFKASIQYHGILFLVGFIFLFAGLGFFLLINILLELQGKIFFIIMGIVFFTVGLYLLYSLISSTVYYYEKSLTKKYGDYITGSIIKLDFEYYKEEKRKICFVEYNYLYDGKMYIAKETFDDEDIYKYFTLQEQIPLQVLSYDPRISFLRVRKYKNTILQN